MTASVIASALCTSFSICSMHFDNLRMIYQTAGAASVISALPGADAVSSGSRGSMLGSLTGVIDRAITSTKSSEMSSFLAEMREALGN